MAELGWLRDRPGRPGSPVRGAGRRPEGSVPSPPAPLRHPHHCPGGGRRFILTGRGTLPAGVPDGKSSS